MATKLPEPREGTLATPLSDPEPERDGRLLDAVGGLFDQLIDRILLSPERVTSAGEGKRLIALDDETEDVADRVQRVAVIATPIVRTLARGSRFLPRVPWVLVASTTASLVVTLRAGVREVRVLGSLVAYRLEQETGRPADPALVKRLTLSLYLAPSSSTWQRSSRAGVTADVGGPPPYSGPPTSFPSDRRDPLPACGERSAEDEQASPRQPANDRRRACVDRRQVERRARCGRRRRCEVARRRGVARADRGGDRRVDAARDERRLVVSGD